MKSAIRGLLFLALAWTLLAAAGGQTTERRFGTVVDSSGKVSQAEARRVDAAVRGFGRPVRVDVEASLPADIDRFSHERFRAEGLAADGLLICVWPEQRKVAMTAGEALEREGVNGPFFRSTVIPSYFKRGWKSGGLPAAVERSLESIKQHLAHAGSRTSASAPQVSSFPAQDPSSSEPSSDSASPLYWVIGLLGLGGFVALVMNGAARGYAGPRGPRTGFGPHPGMDPTSSTYMAMQTPPPTESSSPSVDTSSSSSFDAGGGGFSDTGSGSF